MRIMSPEHWRARGVSKQMISSLTRSGDLVQLRRGVYATKNAVQWADGGFAPVARQSGSYDLVCNDVHVRHCM